VREGRVLEYYWNVQTPAVWTGAGFRQYDLELDVRCRADHTCRVFDREEFLAKRPLYPEAWVARAEEAVEAIFRHMREGRWPVLPPGEPLPWMERL
jgi:protein associated with RNAse G/E